MGRSKNDLKLDAMGLELANLRHKMKPMKNREKELTASIKTLMGSEINYEGRKSNIDLSISSIKEYKAKDIANMFFDNITELFEKGIFNVDKKRLYAWCDLNEINHPTSLLEETRTQTRVLAEAKAS